MKKLLTSFLVALTLIMSGCTSSTAFGPCVGIGDDKNPKLEYKLDTWNLILAIVFFELVAPPVIVAVNETYCPVGVK